MRNELAPPKSFAHSAEIAQSVNANSYLNSIAREGDIILPLELCVLRREETFKQWSARAKRCSIEATRHATGGEHENCSRPTRLDEKQFGRSPSSSQTESEWIFIRLRVLATNALGVPKLLAPVDRLVDETRLLDHLLWLD